jgi:hypothetical protein
MPAPPAACGDGHACASDTMVALAKRSGNHPTPGSIAMAVYAGPEGVALMWLFQPSLLLLVATTVLVHSSVEPLEDRGEPARRRRDRGCPPLKR